MILNDIYMLCFSYLNINELLLMRTVSQYHKWLIKEYIIIYINNIKINNINITKFGILLYYEKVNPYKYVNIIKNNSYIFNCYMSTLIDFNAVKYIKKIYNIYKFKFSDVTKDGFGCFMHNNIYQLMFRCKETFENNIEKYEYINNTFDSFNCSLDTIYNCCNWEFNEIIKNNNKKMT